METQPRRARATGLVHHLRDDGRGRASMLARGAGALLVLLALGAMLAPSAREVLALVRARIAPPPPHRPLVVLLVPASADDDRTAAVRRLLHDVEGLEPRRAAADASPDSADGVLVVEPLGDDRVRLRVATRQGMEGAFGSLGALDLRLDLPARPGEAHADAAAALALAAVAPPTGEAARYQATLLRALLPRLQARWSAEPGAAGAMAYGAAAATLGEVAGDADAMRRAASAFREAARRLERTPDAAGLALARHDLGAVLAGLGARDGGPALLDEAVALFGQALAGRSRDR